MKKHVFLVIVSVIFLSSCSKKLEVFNSEAYGLVSTYKLWKTTQFYSMKDQTVTFSPLNGPRDSAYNNKPGDVIKVSFEGGEFILPKKTIGTIDDKFTVTGNTLKLDFGDEYGRTIYFRPDSTISTGDFRVVPVSVEVIEIIEGTVSYDEGGEPIVSPSDTIRTSVVQDDATKLTDKKGVTRTYTVTPSPFYLYYCPDELTKQIKSSIAKGKKVNNK